jgi:cellulose biosynthesis protein BcsQ
MSVPVLTFFNNNGGGGKTSLVYHLAWMFSELGHTVVAVDLDAQANLTAAFLDEDNLERLWEDEAGPTTVYRAIKPLTEVGDLQKPDLQEVTPQLHLIPGDVSLISFEDALSEAWSASMGDGNLYRPFRILTAFWQAAQMAANQTSADIILMDVGSNPVAINRSALIASDYVVIPLGADLFSLQGLKNLGPTLRTWRSLWQKRLGNWQAPVFDLPQGRMAPLGYILQQHSVRLTRPVKAYDKWINRMPAVYHNAVLENSTNASRPSEDPDCLSTLKHYRSLIPMGQEARKPIFHLTPADGAIGSHSQAVQEAYKDFKLLANKLLERMKMAETAQERV